jgi:hypothetical protein
MKCIICDSETGYFFSKTYDEYPFDEFMRNIGTVDYYKCHTCGFVISKTHCDLDGSLWSELNYNFHHYHENPGIDNQVHQPPYPEQAMMLAILGRNGIIDTNSMIDFAGGYGRLSNILAKYYNLKLPIFDPYVQQKESIQYMNKAELRAYKTVVNSAMFEHVLCRRDLDQVNDLVEPGGCLILHTVVCENVPLDPNWFYLRPPVHTAFHTNKSMEILMKQWNYRSSIYAPSAKCWVLLRDSIETVEKNISTINEELQGNWFCCKNGFVDYWKGF